MVTQDTQQLFSSKILGCRSSSPPGSFTDPTSRYTMPQTGPARTYQDPNIYTDNCLAHPELSDSHRLVLTYNVTSFVSSVLYANTANYRSGFVNVSQQSADPARTTTATRADASRFQL